MTIDPMTQVLAKIDQIDQKEIQRVTEKIITTLHSSLSPYVFEAALRGLNVQADLQFAYGRSKAIPLYESESLFELEPVNFDGEEF